MLKAIRKSQRTITLETYIYWSGQVGAEFAQALGERAAAGVKVHLLLDWVGSGSMSRDLLDSMKSQGVQILKYHPLRWYNFSRLNNRTHRKILVADGRIGFTGGVGIADPWLGNAQDSDHWRDSHYQIEGPAVAQLQAAFMDNWMKASGEVLHGEDYFPEPTMPGDVLAQVFKSSSGEGSESVRLMYLLSIASARKSLRIAAAYFIPDDLSIDTIVAALRRGVTVEIVVPGMKTDSRMAEKASRSRWGALLREGAVIYEYQPTMYHCKLMVVDDLWVSVGSTNFDSRSFRLNDEANLNVFDSTFARGEVEGFERDKGRSLRVTLQDWESRPWTEKAKANLAGLLRSQL